MSKDIILIFSLLFAFQVKHFLADFPLQTRYMLKKFRPDWAFLFPLMAHCFVHAGLTLIICLVVAPHLWFLSLLDFVAHFLMDRIKSGPRYLGRFDDIQKTVYWIAFGLDQMVHHFTHYVLIIIILIYG